MFNRVRLAVVKTIDIRHHYNIYLRKLNWNLEITVISEN